MARKRKKRTAFVPKAIFATAFAGVIPLCAAGCNQGPISGVAADFAVRDLAQPDLPPHGFFDVAAPAFDLSHPDVTSFPDVAWGGFDMHDPPDLRSPPDDMSVAVADQGFGDLSSGNKGG
jgi:hypothetical protein